MTNNDQDDLLIETAQNKDTFNKASVNAMLYVRLLSVRSQEAQMQELANQDYAQVYIQADGPSLCFCVCDGVGSSYRGDFAAKYLARSLVEWMQNLTDLQVRTADVASQLDARLNLWARVAQKELRQVAIPASTPALVREVLEDLRDTYGSETVFLCGRVDLDARSNAARAEEAGGLCSAQLLVCWMGNVTAQLLVGTRAGASPAPTDQVGTRAGASPAPTDQVGTRAGASPAPTDQAGTRAGASPAPTDQAGTRAGASPAPMDQAGTRAGASPRPYENQIPIPERTSPAPTGECVTLGGDDDRVARWSTLRGARGHVSVWKGHLDAIERLVVHTDGLDAIASLLPHLDDEEWQAQARRLLLLPRNDDMTALELRWLCQDPGVLKQRKSSEEE